MWCLIVETYEERETVPVLLHIFPGATKQDCEDTLAAHIKYDSFLRASLTSHTFRGFAVHSIKLWEQQ